MLMEPIRSQNGVEPASPIVRLENASKVYEVGDTVIRALDDVSLDIAKGQFVVILGPSGSGKTTLLNMIGGLDTCTSGNVWVGDQEVTSLGEKALTQFRRHQVGFVFQFFNLVPTLTARENVEMVADLVGNGANAEAALRDVGLGERADHFPHQLSGGEQQRVAIARALAKASPILLCDEPTGELDYETGKMILDVMRRINREEHKTIIMVTHNAAVGRMADRVIRMRSGKIVQDDIIDNPVSAFELEW